MGAQVEKTLALIKPDAVKNGDTDNILQVRAGRRVGPFGRRRSLWMPSRGTGGRA